MQPLVARFSIRHHRWLLLAGLVTGLFLHGRGASRGSSLTIGLLIAVGPPAYRLLQKTFDPGDVIRIDSAGIFDRRLKIGTIPWQEVSRVERQGVRLTVEVKNPGALGLNKTVLSRLNRPLGNAGDNFGFVVNLDGLDVPANRIVEVIETRLSEMAMVGPTI